MNPYNKHVIRWIIVTLMAVMSLIAGAQQPLQQAQLRGTVVDSATGKPLPAATVYLLNDSGRVQQTSLTKENGSFAFPLRQNKAYGIRISAVGYRNRQIAIPINQHLGTIYLSRGTNTLSEVVVTAARPLVRQEADKIIYDLQADPESKGSSVLEMMRKVPFLSVDADQNVLLNGSASYRILINGKPSALTERNPRDVLRSMPAATIKSIEVITSPSSKYDGEGLAGIINIITHKKVDNGYNGTVNVNHRFPVGGPGAGSTFGIKSGKIGLSLMGGASLYNTPTVYSNMYRNTTGDDATTLEQQISRSSNNRNGYLGAELSYDIDSLSLVSAQFNINGNNGTNKSDQHSVLELKNGTVQSYDVANRGERRGNGMDAALNYQRGFRKSKDRLLTFSYRYLQNGNRSADGINIYNPVNYKSPDFNQVNQEDFSEQTLQMDYVHQVKKLNIEAGVKGIFRSNESAFQFLLYDSLNGGYRQDAALTDHFSNQQNIVAAYNSFVYKTKRWMIKTGVRVEHTKVDAHFATAAAQVHQDYLSVIPSASISRPLQKGTTLALNYGSRIQRPSIYQLNPFLDRSNPIVERSGNPDLKPGRGNMIQLSYTRSKKTTMNMALTYMMFDDLIDQVSVYDPATNRTKIRFENAGKARIVRTNLFVNYPVTKNLQLRLNNDLRYIVSHFRAGTGTVKNNVVMAYVNLSGSYRLNKGWRLNGDVTGKTGGIAGIQARTNGFIASSVSVQKDLIADKLTFSASVSNPFSKYRYLRDTVADPGFIQETETEVYFRSCNISLNYRFGKLKEAVKKSKRGIQNDDMEMK